MDLSFSIVSSTSGRIISASIEQSERIFWLIAIIAFVKLGIADKVRDQLYYVRFLTDIGKGIVTVRFFHFQEVYDLYAVTVIP